MVKVTPANRHDGMIASVIIILLAVICPHLTLIWADKGYRGTFVDQADEVDIEVDIVSDERQGFHVQKRRWVVERTFAWLHNYRRLSKDYEELTKTSEATIYAAMTHLMVRRLARLKAA